MTLGVAEPSNQVRAWNKTTGVKVILAKYEAPQKGNVVAVLLRILLLC